MEEEAWTQSEARWGRSGCLSCLTECHTRHWLICLAFQCHSLQAPRLLRAAGRSSLQRHLALSVRLSQHPPRSERLRPVTHTSNCSTTTSTVPAAWVQSELHYSAMNYRWSTHSCTHGTGSRWSAIERVWEWMGGTVQNVTAIGSSQPLVVQVGRMHFWDTHLWRNFPAFILLKQSFRIQPPFKYEGCFLFQPLIVLLRKYEICGSQICASRDCAAPPPQPLPLLAPMRQS